MSKALRVSIFYLPIFAGFALWELAGRAACSIHQFFHRWATRLSPSCASDLTQRPEAAFAQWALLPGKDFYHDPHGLVNEKALQSNVDSLAELKMIPKKFDVSKHVDNSLVQDVMKGM